MLLDCKRRFTWVHSGHTPVEEVLSEVLTHADCRVQRLTLEQVKSYPTSAESGESVTLGFPFVRSGRKILYHQDSALLTDQFCSQGKTLRRRADPSDGGSRRHGTCLSRASGPVPLTTEESRTLLGEASSLASADRRAWAAATCWAPSLCCSTVVATAGAFQGKTVTEEERRGRSLREAEKPHSTDPALQGLAVTRMCDTWASGPRT